MKQIALLALVALVLASCGAQEASTEPRTRLTVAEAVGGRARDGFARASEPRPFVFPEDHGPHQEYAVEWWYYTGNLEADGGRHFGYQLTFFRFGLAPEAPRRASAWAAGNIYMAHFALSDIGGGRFHAFERFSRDGAALAGASGDPFRVWLEDWTTEGQGPEGLPMRLRAAEGAVAIDLALGEGKPAVLQGDRGLSQKSAEPGNASYYYSLTRMPTEGTVRVGGQSFAVRGSSWMDREWSTSALGPEQVGWDWFALQLSDGRELMYYQLRLRDGGVDPYSKGTLVAADGSSRTLAAADLRLDVLRTWPSPRSGGEYPSGWRLQVPSEGIDLRITPHLDDQELQLTVLYWEGAVRIEGTAGGRAVSGDGYVELTGYADVAAEDGVRVR